MAGMSDTTSSLGLAPLSLFFILLGGALGGLLRYWMTAWVSSRMGDAFPWGTLLVNVSGACLIGMVAAWVLPDGLGGGQVNVWAWLVVGGLGSYTTVSSFSLQTLILLRGKRPLRALFNVLLSVFLCLGAAALAYSVMRYLLERGSP